MVLLLVFEELLLLLALVVQVVHRNDDLSSITHLQLHVYSSIQDLFQCLKHSQRVNNHFPSFINKKIINCSTIFIAHCRILCLTIFQFGNIIRHHFLQIRKEPFPVTRTSPIWETSNKPAFVRTASCSALILEN